MRLSKELNRVECGLRGRGARRGWRELGEVRGLEDGDGR